MTEFLFLLLNVLVIVVSGVSFVMWVRLAPRIYRKGVRGFADEWLPATRRECPTWGLAEVFVMFGSMIIFGQLLLQFASSNGWYEFPEPGASVTEQSPDMLFVVLGVSSLANCISIGLVLLWLWNIDRSNVKKIGLSFDRSMFVLGLKSAVMILPPVLMVSALVNLLVVQYEHEVLNVLEKLDSPKVFAVLFFGTAIVTPIAEELLFRGLIQGGLQRLADRFSGQIQFAESGGEHAADSTSGTFENSGTQTDESALALGNEKVGTWQPVSYWPLVVSSFIFAIVHLGQGAAPIPLFVLALGIGYLYRQTGSLIPCIVLHMVLNSLTLVGTLLQ